MNRTLARCDIREAAGVVVNLAITRHRQRVDREIAALGVSAPVASECDLGLAAVGFDILAQGRHLVRHASHDDRNGAMLDAGRNSLDTRSGAAADHFIGNGGRRDIDFADRQSHQCVAHRAADHPRLLAVAIEQRQNARQRLLGQS